MDTALAAHPLTVNDLPDVSWPRHELLEGSLHVTPNPTIDHQRAVRAVDLALTAAVSSEHEVLQGLNIVPQPATVIIPDLAVVEAGLTGLGVLPTQVVLVVEVLSPSTRLRDLTLKRELYRSWAVTYWVVDPDQRLVTKHGDAYRDVTVSGYAG